MKKKALRIQDLKVSSFVTSLDETLSKTIVGANGDDNVEIQVAGDENIAAFTGWKCQTKLRITGCVPTLWNQNCTGTRTSVVA